jgi:hypothetical protein
MTPPIALFRPEFTVYGTVYHPCNKVAVLLCRIAERMTLPEDRIPFIRDLGFIVAEPNGQAIPHPRAKLDVVV